MKRLILFNLILLIIAFGIPELEEEFITISVLENQISRPISLNVDRSRINATRDIKTNADRIYVYLEEKGMSKIQICAILGNLHQESGLNPEISESNGIGYGLAQWSFERKINLLSRYDNPANIYNQLDYLWYELTELKMWTSNYEEIFYNTTSIKEATIAFCNGFERPGLPMLDRRISYSEYYFNLYKEV